MAKMFYTLEEAAAKLGKSPDAVKEMAKSGQVQEFRDRDKLMFKVEQIDLLASGEEGLSLDQELSAGGFDSDQSGSGIGLVDSAEDTGISVFDTAHGDVNDQTQVTDLQDEELSLESVGSGSGLLDLTRESDDTSLGAELLEEVYSGEGDVEVPAHASGLFDSTGAESPGGQFDAPMAVGPILVESYDGAWSGAGVGFMVGTLVALICLALMVFVGIAGATPKLATMMQENLMIYGGGLAAIVILAGVVGLFVGKASE